jgi:hypothetical protein
MAAMLAYISDPNLTHMTATIYSIPPEILRLIFCDSIQDDTLPARVRGKLATVCHQWRQIIIQTASLWTHVTMSTQNKGIRKYHDALIRRLELEVPRAGTLPLNITWRWILWPEDQKREALRREALSFIRRVCPFERWRTLFVQCPFFVSTHEMEPSDSLHNLESLDVVCLHPNLRNLIERTAVHLQHVKLHNYYRHDSPNTKLLELPSSLAVISHYGDFDAGFNNVVYPNITKLQICTDKYVDLGPFPNIRHLKLQVLDFDKLHVYNLSDLERLEVDVKPQTSPSYNTVTMPKLSHLVMTGHDLSSLVNLLAPKLKTFQMRRRRWREPEEATIDPLAEMDFDRLNPDGRCSPSTLEIDIPCYFVTLSKLLHRWDRLETLNISIRSTSDCNEINRLLGEGGSLCPNLVTLRLFMGWNQKILDVDHWRRIAKFVLEKRAGSSMRCVECTWRDDSRIVEQVQDENGPL